MTDYTPEAIAHAAQIVRVFQGSGTMTYDEALELVVSLAERVAKAPTTEAWFPIGPRATGAINVVAPEDFFGKRIALVPLGDSP